AFLALYFTDVLAFAPLPKHVYGTLAPADLVASPENFQPTVTNGPFKVESRVQGDRITVLRDPNYFVPGRPYLDKIIFQVFPDAQTNIHAQQERQIDTASFLPIASYDTLTSIDGYHLVPSTTPSSFEAWYLNVGGGRRRVGLPAPSPSPTQWCAR